MSEFPKPARFDYPLWCRLFGHRWTECEDGWYCWGGAGHAIEDENRMKLAGAVARREPKTIFIIRDTMEMMEVHFDNYVRSFPREIVAKRFRYRAELIDGTRVIGMSRMQAEQGARGYSNVEYA